MSEYITFPGNVESVATLDALRSVATNGLNDNTPTIVRAGVVGGDGLGGLFAWAPSSLLADNGVSIIKPIDLTPLQAGRWLDVYVARFSNLASLAGANFTGPLTFTGSAAYGNQSGWLETLIPNTETATRFKSIDVIGGMGGVFATRSSDSTNTGGDSGHGVSAYGINNNTTQRQSVHAAYFEARGISADLVANPAATASGTTLGIEVASCATGASVDSGPFTSNPVSGVHGVFGTSGRDDIVGSVASTSWMTVYKGPVGYRSGIVFDYQSLDTTGNKIALFMPSNYRATWADSAHNTMDLTASSMTLNSWSNTASGGINYIRARAAGADAQVGDTLMTINSYAQISNVPTLATVLTSTKRGAIQTSVEFTAVNATSAQVTVGLNSYANNSFAAGVDNSITLGAASFRWGTIYSGTGTINTSDARTKQDIADVPPEWLEIGRKIKIRQFRFIGGARLHFGPIAQEIHDLCVDAGLDPFAYGILGQDPWLEQFDEEYTEQEEAFEEVSIASTKIEIRDGKPVQVASFDTEQRAKTTSEPLRDENGRAVLDSANKPVMVPVPVYETVTRTRTATRQKLDENGAPMFLMSIRPDELNFLMHEAAR